jgi:small multidrug resistance family-3 protein
MLVSLTLFVLAGLCEIGGGYLVWQWWRNGASWVIGLIGAIVLVLYGIVPTYQPAHFGRVYAAYGGVFVVLSMLWGWAIDRVAPDGPDVLGATLCLAGVGVIMYSPR